VRAGPGCYHGGKPDGVTIFVTTAQAATVIIAPTDAAHADELPNIRAAAESATAIKRACSAAVLTVAATQS
jgi:hypothetical protein